LDVHRDTVVATVRYPEGKRRCSTTRTFGTNTAELFALGDWLVSYGVTRVGLESTGVYWKPVFYLLEERIAEVWLLNAQHLKNVPGRKTDVADSVWIAQLVEHGLVRPSFVPPAQIRQLRDFTRHRRVLSEERTRMVQRLEKVLQDAGIKLTSVASTVLSKSGRAMLDAMLAGETDPMVLAELAKGRMRSKIPQLADALRGNFRIDHHGVLVSQILAHVDFLDRQLADLDEKITAVVAEFEPIIERVQTIPRGRTYVRDRHDRRDRRGHERFPQRGALGVMGGSVPRQQRLRRQSPIRAHPPRFRGVEDRADRSRPSRRAHEEHLPGCAISRHPGPSRHV